MAAAHAVFFHCLRRWPGLRVYAIYARPLIPPKGSRPAVPGFSFRVFEQSEAEALIACAKRPELELSETFVRDALDKGDACHAILCNDELVSYTWSAFTPTHDTNGVYAGFGEKDRYVYKAFTLPEFRGRHLYRVFKPLGDGYCIARGCTHAIGFVKVDNRPSIHALLALGYHRIGFAVYLKRGPLFVAFRTPGVRRRGFRFFVPPKGDEDGDSENQLDSAGRTRSLVE